MSDPVVGRLVLSPAHTKEPRVIIERPGDDVLKARTELLNEHIAKLAKENTNLKKALIQLRAVCEHALEAIRDEKQLQASRGESVSISLVLLQNGAMQVLRDTEKAIQ